MTKIISEPVSQEELNESLAIQQIMSMQPDEPFTKTVDLSKIDLCNQGNVLEQILNRMNPNAPKSFQELNDLLNEDVSDIGVSDNYAIVEFGDEYIGGTEVTYKLDINPGDNLTEDTKIGEIFTDNNWHPINSIFKSGTILADDKDDKEFKHLFPNTSRHFIVNKFITGSDTQVNQEDINNLKNGITDNSNKYNLIKDHMIFSILPIILANMEKEDEHTKQLHDMPTGLPCPYKEAVEIHDEILKEYDDIIKKGSEAIKNLCNAKKIKSTKGKSSEMDKLGDSIMEEREKLLQDIIQLYKKVGTETCKFNKDILFLLAKASSNISLKTEVVGNSMYTNYYMWLLSKIDTSDSENKVAIAFYEIISNIIKKRIAYESYSKETFIEEFNEVFNNHIFDKTNKNNIGTPYEYMQNKFGNNTFEYSDIKNEMYSLKGINVNTQTSNTDYSQFEPDKVTVVFNKHGNTNIDHKSVSGIQQLSALYTFINSLGSEYNQETKDKKEFIENEYEIFDLIKEEAAAISDFWNNLIENYTPIQDEVKKIKQYGDNLNKTIPWPTPTTLTIDGIKYQHYLFKEPIFIKKEAIEDDIEDYNENEIPDIDALKNQEVQKPSDEAALDALNNATSADENENDLKESDITMEDYDYWKKYFSLATLITLPFLADGLDIYPGPVPTPMPAIYLCFSVRPIKKYNLILIFGLGIRGLYISPLVMCVNTSSQAASPLLPLEQQLAEFREKYINKIQQYEEAIPNLARVLMMKIATENEKYIQDNNKYESMRAALLNTAIQDRELIKKDIRQLTHPEKDPRLNIFRMETISAAWNGMKQLFTNKTPDTDDTYAEEDINRDDPETALNSGSYNENPDAETSTSEASDTSATNNVERAIDNENNTTTTSDNKEAPAEQKTGIPELDNENMIEINGSLYNIHQLRRNYEEELQLAATVSHHELTNDYIEEQTKKDIEGTYQAIRICRQLKGNDKKIVIAQNKFMELVNNMAYKQNIPYSNYADWRIMLSKFQADAIQYAMLYVEMPLL